MKKINILKKIKNKENILVLLAFIFTFIFLVNKPPIYSPDTYGYLHVNISRYPVYILFIRGFQFIFGSFFEVMMVSFQLVFSIISISIIYKNCKELLNLNIWLKTLLFVILLFPLYPRLYIANNLVSEGLAYPLYLLLISFIIDFLYRNKSIKVIHLSITLLILSLTRGQFFFISIIVALLYVLKLKKDTFKKGNVFSLLLLIIVPFLITIVDSSFKKVVYGYYVKTPYSYVNAITLPLFVSELKDTIDIKNEDYKKIFIKSYQRIDSLGLLSSKINGTKEEKYQVFHDNFPLICNQNIHDQGKLYYLNIDSTPHLNSIKTELACKAMFPVLVKNHFKEWVIIYFTGMIHGFFESIVLLFFFLFTLIYGGLITLRNYTINNSLLFLSSLLIISNSMIVALACHSISRYLFYNYFLGFIIFILIFKKITSKI
ncbi:MAG: hypothetical protein ACI9SJ_001841 [Flavobacteriaceae bacterium]